MISRGHTVFQVSNNFDSSLELFVYRYIGILESMQIIHRVDKERKPKMYS